MTDAIIVLGNGFARNGELSEVSQSRVKFLVDNYKRYLKNKRLKIIFSGKCDFLDNKKHRFTQAALMKKYAISLGIPKKMVLTESNAMDTISSAYYVKKKFLEPKKWKDIAVITSDFNVARCEYIFHKVLGKGHTVKILPTKLKMNGMQRNNLLVRERTIMQFYTTLLKNVRDGDDKGIKMFITSSHPWTQIRRVLR